MSIQKNIILLITIFISACANVVPPTGGPKDIEPPKLVSAKPKNKTTNFQKDKIVLTFDEYILLKNPEKQFVIAPAQKEAPELKVKKKTIEIKLKDTLTENTTYTLAFGNSIADNNEGNINSGFSYVFSTGNYIDSLKIKGLILNAETAQPEKNITVLLHKSTNDSIIYKEKPYIYTSTLDDGSFSINNLKPGNYKLTALKDANGNLIYDGKNEWIAFLNENLDLKTDSINNKLILFKESPINVKVTDKKADNNYHLALKLNKSCPEAIIRILYPLDFESLKKLEWNENYDSVLVWIPNTDFDSLKIELSTPSGIDTIFQRPFNTGKKRKEIEFTILDNLTSGKLKPREPLIITFSQPVQLIDFNRIILSQDSTPVTATYKFMDSTHRKVSVTYPFKEELSYNILIPDSVALSIAGKLNKKYTAIFSLAPEEDFGNINFDINIKPGTYITQLLDEKNKIVKEAKIKQSDLLHFKTYNPGKYKFRIIEDLNENGKWDTGNYAEKKQAEKIYYYPDEISLRAYWDLDLRFEVK